MKTSTRVLSSFWNHVIRRSDNSSHFLAIVKPPKSTNLRSASELISEIRHAFVMPDLPDQRSEMGISYLRFRDRKCVCDFRFARRESRDTNFRFAIHELVENLGL